MRACSRRRVIPAILAKAGIVLAKAGSGNPAIAVMAGSVATLPAVWSFADIANALMAIPNLLSLLFLSGVVVAETRQYLWHAGPEHG